MQRDPPPRIAAPGFGEPPPTAGLLPLWRDLLRPVRGETLEAAICQRYGFADIEITSTGTAALAIAFAAVKAQRPGRTVVIVPGYTCPLVVHAAASVGLTAIACDTVSGGFDLDLAHLRQLIDAPSPAGSDTEPLAIVPTHYGGLLTDVETVRRTASGIPLVEDAAQAFGATANGRSVGLSGDIGVFSFGAGKGFTIYEGGALVARDTATMTALRNTAEHMTTSAPLGEIGRAIMLAGYHAAYNPVGLRWIFGRPKRKALARGDEIEAAGDRFDPLVPVTRVSAWRKRVGRAAFDRLDDHIAASRARFERIAARLGAIPGLRVHLSAPGQRPTCTSLFVTLPEHPDRDNLIHALWRARLGVTRMFSRALPDYPDLAPHLLPSETPNARKLAAGTIAVTTSALLSPAAEDAIVAALAEYSRLAV